MATTKRRIHAKGDYDRRFEAVAAEANIKPGMLVKLDANGKVTRHTTSGGALGDENIIVLEDALQGVNVDTAYTIAERVFLAIPKAGSEYNVLIADEENVAVGDKIMAGGSGLFKKNAGGTKVIAVAVEDNDLTGSNTSNKLSQVRFV